jgi:ABC-type thiamin/hydroxymethylpyrimidine transport system permease subunit
MKVCLLTLIVLAAVGVILCGVWVTAALIIELWPRRPGVRATFQAEQTPTSQIKDE